MARSLGEILADSLQFSLNYAQQLLKDVPAERFARLAAPGGAAVQSNHPAFVLGHLSTYAPRMIGQLGGDASAVAVPERIAAACSKDATCQDDPHGTIYPPMEEVAAAYFNGYRAVQELLRRSPDSAFDKPNPAGGRFAELFPSLGSVHAFLVGGHMMMHLGQFSAWRRMEGLPPA